MTDIEIKPTWSGVLPALLAAIELGTDKGRSEAAAQLLRMARMADLLAPSYEVMMLAKETLEGIPHRDVDPQTNAVILGPSRMTQALELVLLRFSEAAR